MRYYFRHLSVNRANQPSDSGLDTSTEAVKVATQGGKIEKLLGFWCQPTRYLEALSLLGIMAIIPSNPKKMLGLATEPC